MAKILLADDSTRAQRMGTQILTAEGHQVITVSNGHAAVKMLQEDVPDLIVADVFMPGKTGYEVCQFVKTNVKLRFIPVVLMVAPMEPYDETEGKRVKADGLVTKPLESSNLVATVSQLLAFVKKFAPPPPPPETAATEPAFDSAGSGTYSMPVTVAPEELTIPEDILQQPVMMEDLLETPQAAPVEEVPGADRMPSEEPAPEAVPLTQPWEIESKPFVPVMEAAQTEAIRTEMNQPLTGVESYPDEGIQASLTLPTVETSAESEMLPPTLPVEELPSRTPSHWTADSVEVTEEDRKMFEPPPPDWQGLVSMVEEEKGDGKFSPVSSASTRPGLPLEALPAEDAPVASVPLSEARPLSAEHPAQALMSATPEAMGEEMIPAKPLKEAVAAYSDSTEMQAPAISPLDYATLEQIVREKVEEMLPEIVERIAQATGAAFRKKP